MQTGPVTPTRPASGYGRVSMQEQAEEGVSLALQRERCEAAARAAGYPSLDWYEDAGLSGGRADNRPRLQELLAAVRAGRYDAVYIYRLDRLSRSVFDGIEIIRDLVSADVRLVSVSEGFDFSSAMGRLIVTVLLAVAQWFLDTLHDSVRNALRYIQQGGRHIGKAPYGYRHPGDKQPLEVEPSEAAIVRRIYAEYAGGAQLAAICRGLNADGLRNRSGRIWRTSVVRSILSNRTLLGETQVAGGLSVPGLHPAIIEPAQWRAAQDRLAHNSSIHPRSRGTTLARLYRCGECGAPVVCTHHSTGRRMYRCGDNRFRAHDERHPPATMSAHIADGITWRVLEWLADDGIVAHWQASAAQARRRDGSARKRATLQREHGRAEESVLRNAEAYQAGAVSLQHLQQLNAPLLLRLQTLEEQLAALAEPAAVAAAQLLGSPEVVYRVRQGGTEEQLRLLLGLLERVEIRREGLRYVWRYPDAPVIDVPRPRHKCPPDEWFAPPPGWVQ